MNYIIKTIQGCNLSCTYCYEQSHNRRNLAMSLEDATGFIRKVYEYYVCNKPEEELAFHWHGGEPMLLGAEFFEEIIRFQIRVMGKRIRWHNTMQSNLTLLDDAFIRLFQKHRRCLALGVSFDFFGDARVDQRNRNVNALVWRNVKRLKQAGLPTTFLTMLTKENILRVDEIYNRVHSQRTSIQFNQIFGMPKKRAFHRSSVRLRNTQFSEALQRITRRWLAESDGRSIINNADRVLKKIIAPHLTRICWYEKNCLEFHMAICPDGTVFPCDSFYIKNFSYGNIFHDPYEKLLLSKPRQQLLEEQKRVLQECRGCQYLDYCNGGCPTRSIFSMPQGKVRLHKDPLCSMHCGLFEMIGQALVRQGLVKPDWANPQRQKH